ncbi:MAG: divergent polysaccharide deacetylase family protein [Synergistaceae bacterium]|nr:divergent polysaccharide deacetylase family protein [Synergistaceae bacterium]
MIDDCGSNMSLARRVLSCDVPVTWAILPNLKYSKDTAELLREKGVPFLIHVPMQAEIDSPGRAGRGGPYLIGANMPGDEIRKVLLGILDSMGGALGVNNHRGSKATSDREVMDTLMEVLTERDLFFLDSRTSSRSVAYDSALEHGLNAAYNSRFLDNESDRDKIAAQMEVALKLAQRRGMIAVICHMRPATVTFLEDFAGELEKGDHKSGVKFITLAEWPDYAKGEIR